MVNSMSAKLATKARKPKGKKPAKTRYPLWLHAGTGQWCKKIKGKVYYFGTDQKAALPRYTALLDDIKHGRTSRPADESERVTLKTLCNAFLTNKKSRVTTGELSDRSFRDYLKTAEGLAAALGKESPVDEIKPEDLERYRRKLGERLGAVALGNEIARCRSILHYAFNQAMIDKPVRFGEFAKPKKSAMRKARAAKGSRLFEPAELRQILKAADVQMKAMIYLAINCGFGNSDVGTLPINAVDLEAGWIDYPRPKTGIARRCPLWPETVTALKAWLAIRRQPITTAQAGLMFVTKYGASWHNGATGGCPVSAEFRKRLDALNIYRPGLSFYAIRHTFQTIADDAGDYLATRRIMGHADNSISDHYRERFDDAKLIRVAEHVRGWLFGEGAAGSSAAAELP